MLAHLAAASASYAQAISLHALADDPRFPWTPDLRGKGRATGKDLAQAGEAAPFAVAQEAGRRLREMLKGIERYQAHPFRRDLPDPPTIWRRGAARLLDFSLPGARGPALIAVPSLVNRAYILDLHPQRSLLRWLADQGFRPMLFDWGMPEREERDFDLSAYHRHRLVPAAEAAVAHAGGPVAALGYCMGGAFVTALSARRPDLVARLALIGAPWDFSKLQGLGEVIAALAARQDPQEAEARIRGVGQALGAIPVDALQFLFAGLDPTLALRKFRAFARKPEGLGAELFVATEDWLNDGVTMSAPAAVDVALGWYMRNETVSGDWILDGEPVVPQGIDVPALAFCSAGDRLSPPACAEALPRAIPGARIRRPRTGHVGMIIGSRAPAEVWSPLARFLAE